jgi:hypothetical protein
LGKLAPRAQKVDVIDAERVIPGWKANGNPFVVREHFSRGEFASEIVDVLNIYARLRAEPRNWCPLLCCGRASENNPLQESATASHAKVAGGGMLPQAGRSNVGSISLATVRRADVSISLDSSLQ